MKQRTKHVLISMIILLLIVPVYAQGEFNAPRASTFAYMLAVEDGTVQLAQLNQSFSPTIDIDYNPVDPLRWARSDEFGIPRFTDPGNPAIVEGVYTFSPFFDGYGIGMPQENKSFVREVEWSPDGQMFVFRSQNEQLQDISQGVWFWQPLRELATDPSYQILRHCPPHCSAAGTHDGDPGWRATSLEWSSDNNAVLIGLDLLGEQRSGLEIRYARRDSDLAQAGTRPNPILFDYGHWANDGQQIVVSGRGPDGTVSFGMIDRTISVTSLTPAVDVSLAWVQDAVQNPDGELVMLGNTSGYGLPLQIFNAEGEALTGIIGEAMPESVTWSPDRSAVLIQTSEKTYLAQTNGAIYEITDLLDNNSPNIDWVAGSLPPEVTPIPLPEPIIAGRLTENEPLNIGDLLVVESGILDVYTDPIGNAPIATTLVAGDELIITGGPLEDQDTLWYRIQTIEHSGWIRNVDHLAAGE